MNVCTIIIAILLILQNLAFGNILVWFGLYNARINLYKGKDGQKKKVRMGVELGGTFIEPRL